ncbi:MAG TPA: glycosyl transferase family 36 [Peptococcaceae bacterium]|nr:glycosyl transferase family 36 [Peptococcaceae bacterium]
MKSLENNYAKINGCKSDRNKEILDYALELAQFHNWVGLKKNGKSLLPLIKEYSSFIKGSYSKINEYYYKTHDVIPAAEWYLDNYYLISELINELVKNLSKEYESKLWYLSGGDNAGTARIYLLIQEYINVGENELSFQMLKNFIARYQTEAPLSSAEIWAIPIMLKIILLKKIYYQVERIIYIQKERELAEVWLNSVLGRDNKAVRSDDSEFNTGKHFSPVFIEKVARRLKEHGPDAKLLLKWLDNVASKQNMNVEKVISSEQYFLTSQGVQMGSIIATLKRINSENWSEFFESVSLVQQILERDPAGVFKQMDFESRDKYRHIIESLADNYKISELTVAQTIEKLAAKAQEAPLNHVGYYLCGNGRIQLEKELTASWGKVKQSFHGLLGFYKHKPVMSYLGLILIATILPFFLFLDISGNLIGSLNVGVYFLAVICVFLLLNCMAVYVVNWFFCRILPPSFLPKLDFSNGIPDEYKTVVVIPAIFNNAAKVREQLRQLEVHYLNNPDKNLYFALLGDFSDAKEKTMPGDEKIIAVGIKGIQKLNAKYGKDKFFYFHRARQWNEKEKVWMGWERKRGKLIEFNSLLLGDRETTYQFVSSNYQVLRDIRYVITLDADTILPKNSAHKLVGTIAHPMQAAQMDPHNNKVIAGYGIIQPRIGLTASSAFATPFSALLTGTAGLDPYTCAISDIYQDLFGEGIFTGKGIYDLRVFHSVTKDAFPENTILSHDLIEGLYARTGLATDIQLFDGFPSKYLAHTKRTHRWIRGDWQIARYILNPQLSIISRWKIIDNLRRSIEAPLQLLLLFLAFTSLQAILPLLMTVVFLSFALPLILNLGGRILDRSLTVRILKHELCLGLAQIFFAITVLPYQAYIQFDAVVRSLCRQFITKRSLLEWEPAADSDHNLKVNWKNFYVLMLPGIVLSLFFLWGYVNANLLPSILLSLLIICWVSSPLVAYKLSLPYPENSKELTANDRTELRKWARQIWTYFEFFVSEDNNYLPPDNVQLEPYKGAARRTSPTNIGLALLANLAAEDFGYISKPQMLNRVRQTLKTIDKLPKWNGHIYNWYNTANLEPLYPIYISTVDSGNFATYLLALKNGLSEYYHRPLIEKSILEGLEDTYNLIGKDDNYTGSEVIQDFGCELQELKNNLKQLDFEVLRNFTNKWLERLQPYTINIEEIKDKNIPANSPEFWLTVLVCQLKNNQKALELYYPHILDKEIPGLEELASKSPVTLIKNYVDFLRQEHNLPEMTRAKLKKGIKYNAIFLLRVTQLQKKLQKIAYGMNFKPLYDEQKGFFSIGYNLSEQKLDKSYYDLLASEARQTSLFAIAKGDVPETHWFKLARPLTRINGKRSLVSWSGTMFEFLMPLILFRNYRGTLLSETYQSVVKIQQKYAEKEHTPWGISESGFFSYDLQSNYQYKAFGVPGLGLKRGLAKDMVISPYSTFMALAVDLQGSIANLRMMKDKGFNGIYGLFEAIDYTKSRVPYNAEFSIVKSYMSHHQGMSFISLDNTLHNNKMQKRFHREPRIKSVELLLQEQIPLKEYTYNPSIEEVKEEIKSPFIQQQLETPAVYYSPDTSHPRTSFISNREYTVMLTLTGSGYSQYKNIFITRWREDPTIDSHGSYIYIQNLNSGEAWSATSKPVNNPGSEYRVTCFPNGIKYYRQDGNIITQSEVFVAPEDPVEIRKVSLTNLSKYSRDVQLTSYYEIVLDELKADLAHPAFGKLFIQTWFENDTLIAFRRPRHQGTKTLYAMHTILVEGNMLGELEYETDRAKFIGRGRTLANPKALDYNQPLSNSVGNVLDPILSLRARIRIGAGKTAVVYYLTGVGETKETVLHLAEKYRSSFFLNQAKELSWSQNLMELTNLNLTFEEANRLSSLAGQIIFPGPMRRANNIKNNKLGQSSLWPFGISGDLPLVLLKIQDNNHLKQVDQMLKIHEYWKVKGLFVDLVILNEDKSGYFQSIQEMIQEKISLSHARKLVNKPGGVFLLKKDQLSPEAEQLLHTVSRLVFSGENGSLQNQIKEHLRVAERRIPLQEKIKGTISPEVINGEEKNLGTMINQFKDKLLFYNGYGGFTPDGREYIILLENSTITPLPWVNVLANPSFGTLITEAGSSYTWSQNSREYKLSPWFNDPILDLSGEALYLKDEKTGYYWSPTPQPVKDQHPYIIRHGQGYSKFEHLSQGIQQETTVFIPLKKNLKVVQLTLTNTNNTPKSLTAYYYVEWVLGVNREQNSPYLVTEVEENTVFCQNVYQEEFKGRIAFLSLWGEKLKSYTTDRKQFIGVNRDLQNPFGLEQKELAAVVGQGLDPCAVIQAELVLEPFAKRTIYFLLGDEENKEEALALIKEASDEKQLSEWYTEILKYWDDLLTTIEIHTPEKSFDLLFNRWLLYQTLGCRIWARSAFYQSGGAIGFRDQLQDAMPFAVIKPEITRKQIILHSSRQFPEGDVQHWWHPEKGKGIRTKFSDDLLWLPYVTADYIQHTGDESILEEKTPFITQDLLGQNEDERYTIPKVSEEMVSVYEHCVRAIDRSLKFGKHGLPLIGTGDWNDGFSAIGREGKGESVWLGWFILTILKSFLPICQKKGDEDRVKRYQEVIQTLTNNMEKNAWDGAWYRRAYYDDGSPLGSILNTECQIDSLAQTWAIISGCAQEGRAKDGMQAVERYLWNREEGIIKLFTPAFDKTDKNPGYIKGYIPGVRENGGQYTHGAIWAVLALTRLKEREKALELYNMLNPINHARTNTEVLKYKVEPYVMAADVYAVSSNVGRGGWTWYTGSAGWMYQVGLEGILGFNLKNNQLNFSPCVPFNWLEYSIKYRYKSTVYNIIVKLNNPDEQIIILDGVKLDSLTIDLKDDGVEHVVEVFI